jgi:hypothetical protein
LLGIVAQKVVERIDKTRIQEILQLGKTRPDFPLFYS